MGRDWELTIRHVYREANYVADHLANRGHEFSRGSHLIDSIDCRLAHFVRYDGLVLSSYCVPELVS
ncbi:hypothetical protein LINPERPRIM_LOCUS2809 [Linum perenne]